MLGGTSLTLTELQSVLRRELDIDAGPDDLLRDATVAGVAALGVADPAATTGPAADGSPASPLLIPLRASGDASAVFLVHGGLGLAFVSPVFIDAIGGDHPIHSFQAKGLTGGAAPHRSIEAMAADYVAAIDGVRPNGPHVLVGICAGSIIALEMAHRLRDVGQPVAALVMVDPPFPPHARPWISRMRDIAVFTLGVRAARRGPGRLVASWIGRRISALASRVRPTALRPLDFDQQDAERVALSIEDRAPPSPAAGLRRSGPRPCEPAAPDQPRLDVRSVAGVADRSARAGGRGHHPRRGARPG